MREARLEILLQTWARMELHSMARQIIFCGRFNYLKLLTHLML